mgnify:CR=1 FL=1
MNKTHRKNTSLARYMKWKYRRKLAELSAKQAERLGPWLLVEPGVYRRVERVMS